MEDEAPDMSLSAPSNLGFNIYMTPYTPQNFGRPSSPLNPHAGSSSPVTSPTPQHLPHPHTHFTLQHHHYPLPPVSAGGPARPPRIPRGGRASLPSPSSSSSSTRYARRPTAPAQARSSLPSGSGTGLAGPLDLFTEGTSPVQGQLWRDRLGRRMEERERRKRSREDEMGRRRGMMGDEGIEDQEEADKRAQEDDEEVSLPLVSPFPPLTHQIFRRLMVLQRRKAEHAALVSHEQETGGSDPLESEFWEDEMSQFDHEERELSRMVDDPTPRPNRFTSFASSSSLTTPQHRIIQPRRERGGGNLAMGTYREPVEEEEDWAEEAAAAEEAEREAEELALLERVEREYVLSNHGLEGAMMGEADGGGMEVDWEELEQMDME